MGHWQDRIVYFRDFAYNARRLRMANGNIGHVPASTFAEYVPASSELPDPLTGSASDAASRGECAPEAESNAPPESVPQFALEAGPGYPVVRPALAHRLYSHRLHVRAKAKLQRDRLLSGPMVDIYVGKSKRHWALHRNLLCHHSELLESELQSDGAKKQDTLELPDHDPAGFELLVKWLYQGRLDDVSDMATPNQKYDYAVSCHKLYLLCDRFDMPQLKNVAMDQYRKGLNEAELVPDAEEINDIYRKSPPRSPFRRLVTRIAARQIMDPASDRDVETYRECFENNPDFAVDLVNAIRLGTGGMLFEDPTDAGNECEYHDHEAGPNCHIKGKGKKQVFKASATARLHDPKSAKSDPSESSVPRPLPRHPPRLIPNPQPPPRQVRRQDGINAGPLRRRLTSPASSTVKTSTENATATHPSPKEQRDKFRQVTLPEKRLPSPALEEELLPAQDALPQSSGGDSRPLLDSSTSDEDDKGGAPKQAAEESPPRRKIWEWAKVGTGGMGIMGRIPHPEWKGPGIPGIPGIITSKAANWAVNGALGEGKTAESQDDFSIPSSTSTEPENEVLRDEVAAARTEGLGISNSTVDPTLFSQTKRSSDDLVASANGTPSPEAIRTAESTGGSLGEDSGPTTPSSTSRKKDSNDSRINGGLEGTPSPSPHRIPKYKIALAANILSPAKTTI